MRTALFVLPLIILTLVPVAALEKFSVPDRGLDRAGGWSASGSTCSLAYYNTCNGWMWIWGGWWPEDVLGVAFEDLDSPGTTVLSNWIHIWTSAPGGATYGFAGTIGIYATDLNGCPTGPPIESQTFDPVSGWNQYLWSAPVGLRWAVQITMGPGVGNPMTLTTDHPAQGPTGPPACGSCYPTSRANHSYYWGSAGSPFCPGSSFFDGTCDSQLLVDCTYTCADPVSIESTSWAGIKAIYR